MRRKDFIRTGILTGAGMTLAKMLHATEVDKINMAPICIYDNYLKGTTYYKKAPEKINFSEPLSPALEREPNNKYDHFAVALYVQGRKIGYLPAYENVVIARMLDAGVRMDVLVKFDDPLFFNKNDYFRNTVYVQLFTELLTHGESFSNADFNSLRADDMSDVYRQGWQFKE
ncbi:MAG: HIRAN domain-containing protein [Brumimicrobium sp.]|nr:HIRAN domain-containing protein [Brumimicrobium sp.]